MLERNVQIDGKVYVRHELVQVTVIVNDSTVACVRSADSDASEVIDTYHSLPYSDSLELSNVEEQLWALPAFEDYADSNPLLDEVLAILTDEQADQVIDAFPAWQVGKAYEVGTRVRYNSLLYKCIQAHTSQADWTPDAAVSLWVRVGEPGEIPEWVQPTGAHDAYAKGDKVKHNAKVWTSDIDANVYEPGVYGWTETN